MNNAFLFHTLSLSLSRNKVLKNGIDYGHVTINNQIYRKYPVPDASTYQLEETSGFYYDALTCLYYDPNSRYYYNGTTQKYMYWSTDYQTYIPIESQQPDTTKTEKNEASKLESESKKDTNGSAKDEDKLKNDKVKMAKKIAKDMEKWAKTMNQKNKESTSKQALTSLNQDDASPANRSDNYNSLNLGNTGISLSISSLKESNKPKLIEKNPLLFESLNDEDEDEDNKMTSNFTNELKSTSAIEEEKSSTSIQKLNLTDWNKLICLLCKRRFSSKEQLSKHQQASELHKVRIHFKSESLVIFLWLSSHTHNSLN